MNKLGVGSKGAGNRMSECREMSQSVNLDRDCSKIKTGSRCLRTPGSSRQKWAEGERKMNTYTQPTLISFLHQENEGKPLSNHFRKAKGKYENLPRLPPSCIFLPSNSDFSRNHSLWSYYPGLSLKSFFLPSKDVQKSQFLHKAFPGYMKRGHTDFSLQQTVRAHCEPGLRRLSSL